MRVNQVADVAAQPLSVAEILTEEAAQLGIALPPPNPQAGLSPLHLQLNRSGIAALCLSGGGIRSAAFSLGVMQRLAAEPLGVGGGRRLLSEFRYLSTVSGGGYVGAWLSAWLMRARISRERGIGAGSADVLAALADTSAATEAPAIENLRVNSNYLTPKVGAMSADLWADIATYGRNLLLNWLVVAPLVACLVLLLKLLQWGQHIVVIQAPPHILISALVFACCALLIPLTFESANRPTVAMMNVGQKLFLWFDLFPALLAGLAMSIALGSAGADALPAPWNAWPVAPACGGLLYLGAWLGAPAWRHWRSEGLTARVPGRRRWLDSVSYAVAGAVFGAVLRLFPNAETALGLDHSVFVAVFGIAWLLLARLVGEVVFIALTSSWHRSDEDRAWFARAAGWYVAAQITCVVGSALILLASPIIDGLYGAERWALGAVGGVSGLVTMVLGNSSLTSFSANKQQQSLTGRLAGWALAVSTPIFSCLLLVAVSATLDRVLLQEPFLSSPLFGAAAARPDARHLALVLLLAAAGACLVAVLAGLRVDINQFSLHTLYRDRLVRCFLAASRHSRPYRNRFTDFDEFDNPTMHGLRAAMAPGEAWRPLHLINAALNIVSTKNLAWQQRKAESFTFSPLHAGSACVANGGSVCPTGSYRRVETYGRGIKLGTAMAISGAAANPNSGYNSSPPVAFFMTLFNVRLGWWLGNPGPAGARTAARRGPLFATGPLIDEAFGLTTDDHPYVDLSDGGHFENLGLYEMVRRRCRFIVVVDAGCDPDFAFEDLGNAVRKVWLDHRVRISFQGLDKIRPRMSPLTAGPYHAMGTIHYAEADGALAKDGVILYLKPSLHGTESIDVLAYGIANPSFPHESTVDQWFSESQFESYRALGSQVMASVLDSVAGLRPFGSLEQLMTALAANSA